MKIYSSEISGSLKVRGDIKAENYIVQSTVTQLTQSFISGSTISGDSADDTHQFTGSLSVTGSAKITANDNATFHVASSTTNNDAFVRITEGSNYFGGFIKYAGTPNILELGVHNVNDSDVNNDTTAIQILRENNVGDVIFPIANQKVSGSSTSTGSFGFVRAVDDVAGKRIVAYSNYGGSGFETSLKDNKLLFGYGGDEDAYGEINIGNSYMDFKTNSGANPLLRVHKSDGTIEAFSGHFSGSINSTGSFGHA